jgi:hypothetical protein
MADSRITDEISAWRGAVLPNIRWPDDPPPDPAEILARQVILEGVGQTLIANYSVKFAKEIRRIVEEHGRSAVFRTPKANYQRSLHRAARTAPVAARTVTRGLKLMMGVHRLGWDTRHWNESWDAAYDKYRNALDALKTDPALTFFRTAKTAVSRGNPLKARNAKLRSALIARGVKRREVIDILRGIGFVSVKSHHQ